MRRHPWIFEGAVAHLKGRVRAGDTVAVFADNGRPLGRAAFSPHSQIRARMWSFDPDETIDHAFFKRRVAAAAADAGADARILRRLAAAPDHPVALAFPEGEYLKGLLCQVV